MTTLLRTSVLALAATLSPVAAHAQNYVVTTGSGSLVSIAGSGTSLSLTGQDDGTQSFAAPISFPFFGTTITAGTLLYVSTNGLIVIGVSDSEYNNAAIPVSATPNGFLAPFWDDLTALATSEVYWAQVGSEIVVQWNAIANLNVTTESITFQARISSTGLITYVYGARIGGTAWSGTVGIENDVGSLGQMLPCGPSCALTNVPANSTVILTPGAAPAAPDLTATAGTVANTLTAGTSFLVQFNAINSGDVSAASNDAVVFASTVPNVTIFDDALGSTRLPAIAAGGSASGMVSAQLPAGYNGLYYFALILDASEEITEGNENNNVISLGSATVTPPAKGDIVITTTSLPNGDVGFPYDTQLTQTGAMSPTWSISSGMLPAGISLSTTGRLTGTPTTEGASNLTITAAEAGLMSASRAFTLTVDGNANGIRLVSNALPSGTVGAPYSGAFEATGGTGPYGIQVIVGKPGWMIVDGVGAVTGTPDAPSIHQMTVSIVDSLGAQGTASAALEIVAAGPLALATSLPAGIVGRNYSASVAQGGQPPYVVTVAGGALPPGFTIDSSAVLSGAAAATGSFTFDLSVTDSATPPAQASGTLGVTIADLEALEITTRNINVTIKTDTNERLAARGGVPPYTWSVSGGALLPGLTFDGTTGTVGGRTEMVATTTVTFTVSDTDGATATEAVQVKSQIFVTTSGATRRDGGCACTVGPRRSSVWTSWMMLMFAGIWIGGRRVLWARNISRVERRSLERSDPRRRRPKSSSD